MGIIISKLTTKSQTTVPKQVRDALNIGPGDTIAYDVHGDRVILRKVAVQSGDELRGLEAMLSEWASAEDAEAYDDL